MVAEKQRDDNLICMEKTMDRVARFSIIARDDGESCLQLRGYMNLNHPCTRVHLKKILGKYSNCRMTCNADVLNLLKYFNIDRNATVTGELPSTSRRKKDNAKWVLRSALDKKEEFERVRSEVSETDMVVDVADMGKADTGEEAKEA